ncbi:MAG: hypothetical protein H6655_21275 [Ardenticatenaceae bacterium]|nr:hypothetical protein [Ardenticatenaceae bacterium]
MDGARRILQIFTRSSSPNQAWQEWDGVAWFYLNRVAFSACRLTQQPFWARRPGDIAMRQATISPGRPAPTP